MQDPVRSTSVSTGCSVYGNSRATSAPLLSVRGRKERHRFAWAKGVVKRGFPPFLTHFAIGKRLRHHQPLAAFPGRPAAGSGLTVTSLPVGLKQFATLKSGSWCPKVWGPLICRNTPTCRDSETDGAVRTGLAPPSYLGRACLQCRFTLKFLSLPSTSLLGCRSPELWVRGNHSAGGFAPFSSPAGWQAMELPSVKWKHTDPGA